jgi:hypothetical protein
MTFTETLFGGLLAVIALYFLARRLRLSNYWSAFISGAVPFLGYLFYSLSTGFAGDVLTIHLVVFLATAGVLGVFGGMKRSKEGMHWAPKLLIAFFSLLVVFNATLLSIAMHGLPDFVFRWFLPKTEHTTAVHTGFPGAVPHDRNKLYEPHLQRIEQQRSLGWRISTKGLDVLRKTVPSEVLISILDKEGTPLTGATVSLVLWRMANSADDRRVPLEDRGNGSYGVRINLADAGNWIAEVYIERGKDSYLMQQPVTVAE